MIMEPLPEEHTSLTNLDSPSLHDIAKNNSGNLEMPERHGAETEIETTVSRTTVITTEQSEINGGDERPLHEGLSRVFVIVPVNETE